MQYFQILVGSNMSTWLMMLAALERPHRIHSIVGISSAPDLPFGTQIPLSDEVH